MVADDLEVREGRVVDKQNKVEWENPTARWQMEGARTKHPTKRAVGNPARLASLRGDAGLQFQAH